MAYNQPFDNVTTWRGDEDEPVYSLQRSVLGVSVPHIVVWQPGLLWLISACRKKRTFTAPDGQSYKWDIDFSIVRVSMPVYWVHKTYRLPCFQLSRDDGTGQELARSHRRSYGIIGSKHDPYLEIHPDLGHILDMVVLTFIYVEKLRMDDEDTTKYSA